MGFDLRALPSQKEQGQPLTRPPPREYVTSTQASRGPWLKASSPPAKSGSHFCFAWEAQDFKSI